MSEIQYGESADEFKPLAEVCLPDPRQKAWVRLTANGMRPTTLEDYYDRASDIFLHSEVPEDVRIAFDTARNLFIYSWFVYRFGPVAEMQAYAALDYALTKRIGSTAKRMVSLPQRMNHAIEQGWLKDEGIRFHRRKTERHRQYVEQNKGFLHFAEESNPPPDQFVRILQDSFRVLRNSLAHGEPMLGGGVAHTLELCCDLINQLFVGGASK